MDFCSISNRTDKWRNNKEYLKQLLKEAIKTLSEREQAIVQKRYLTEHPQTLEDLGAEFHISRERVRQIETKALEKIKKSMQSSAQKLALV